MRFNIGEDVLKGELLEQARGSPAMQVLIRAATRNGTWSCRSRSDGCKTSRLSVPEAAHGMEVLRCRCRHASAQYFESRSNIAARAFLKILEEIVTWTNVSLSWVQIEMLVEAPKNPESRPNFEGPWDSSWSRQCVALRRTPFFVL